MKVLHLVPTLGSGGAERQLYLLCRESRDRVTHAVAAAWREGRWAEPLRSLGITVHCLDTGLRDPRLLPRLRRLVSREAPDLLHCWLPSMNLAGIFAGFPLPVIASVRNVDDWKPLGYRVADRLASPFWSAVVCNSWAGAEFFLKSTGMESSRIHVVPNGVEPKPAPPRAAGSEQTVCTACRLVPQKRVDRVVELARQLPGFRFRIAGDGPELTRLRASAPSNVEFLGQVADLDSLWTSSRVFVLASEREGMSNSLLEAMQAGCVPVVTGAGDNARIVAHGQTGYVVQPEAMPEAVRAAAAGWPGMSAAAISAAQAYTVSAMAEETLQIYRSVRAHAAATHAHPIPRLH